MEKDGHKSESKKAQEALVIVRTIQEYFVQKLNELSKKHGEDQAFKPVSWLRDEGRHGGGTRFVACDDTLFNRASVNVSQVQYDDDSSKPLGSATALSTIIHPQNPFAPSIHMHISWTQMKSGKGYWRMMADLNPAIEDKKATERFLQAVETLTGSDFKKGKEQGDRYFYIPVFDRHRGVAHFYLENYSSGDEQADARMALELGKGVIDCYIELVKEALAKHTVISDEAKAQQLAYHTLYLFQVLTLDRGTTSGLLVHDQNDVGIMGSIPRFINRELLASWREKMSVPQDQLLDAIVASLPQTEPALVDDSVKLKLAKAVREHYQRYPQALSMQASGDMIPDTVNNHSNKV